MKALNLFGALLALLTVAAIFLALQSLPVKAAQQCAPLATALEQLGDRWGEAVRGQGLAFGGTGVLVFLRDETGDTWTMLLAEPSGRACILATGTGWEDLPAPPLGTEG